MQCQPGLSVWYEVRCGMIGFSCVILRFMVQFIFQFSCLWSSIFAKNSFMPSYTTFSRINSKNVFYSILSMQGLYKYGQTVYTVICCVSINMVRQKRKSFTIHVFSIYFFGHWGIWWYQETPNNMGCCIVMNACLSPSILCF